MEILIVANGFPPGAYGGVENYSHDLAIGLQERGHHVTVFCRESDESAPDYTLRESIVDGIPVIRVVNNFKRIQSYDETYRDARIDRIFAGLLDRLHPDLVHFNHLIGLSSGLTAVTHQMGIPALLFLHDYHAFCHRVHLINRDSQPCFGPGNGADCYWCITAAPGPPTFKSRLLRLAKVIIPFRARLWLRHAVGRRTPVMFPLSPASFITRRRVFEQAVALADLLVVPSGFVRDIFKQNGYADTEFRVLPLGIHLEGLIPAHPGTHAEVNLGFAGTIIIYKGIFEVAAAVRSLPDENIRLHIYGRNDIEPNYTRMLEEVIAGDPRILLHGGFPPERRAEIFAGLDLLVVPSIGHETFSLVTREALAAGLPVLATRVGALPEAVLPGVNGWLVEPADSAAIARVIASLAADPGQLRRLDVPGPVEILTVDQHIDRIEALYAEILPGG